jgi:hypothetical protein
LSLIEGLVEVMKTFEISRKASIFQWVVSLLLLNILLPSLSQASPIKLCQGLIETRYQVLNIQRPAETFKELTPCVDELVATHNPAIFAQDDVQVEELECGLLCRHWDRTILGLASSSAFTGMIRDTIEANLSQEHLKMLEESYDGGLQAIIDDSIEEFYANQPKTRSRRRKNRQSQPSATALQIVILNVFEELFYAETKKAKLHQAKGFNVDEKNKFFRDSMRQCLQVAQTIGHISFCASSMKHYVPIAIGEDILQHTLTSGLMVSPLLEKKSSRLWDASLESYQSCMVHYVLNSNFSAVDTTQYVQSCVYQALLSGFKEAGVVLVGHEMAAMNLSDDRAFDLVEQGIKRCEPAQIFAQEPGSQALFNVLLEQNPKGFETHLRRCQGSLEQSLVSQMASVAIAQNPQVKAIMGEQSQDLAKQVVDNHFPVCLREIQKVPGRSAKNCGGYLMVKSVFSLIETHAKEKIDEVLAEMNGVTLTPSDKGILLEEAVAKMSTCEQNLSKKVLRKNFSDKALESEITQCIKPGLSHAVKKLAQIVFEKEVKGNSIIIKYNVQLGPNIITESIGRFSQCFEQKTTSASNISGLMRSIKPAVDNCQVVAMRNVLLVVADQVLIQELQRTGMSESQILKLLQDYKQKDNSLHRRVQNATTREEINTITKRADYEVVKGLAYEVLSFLIKKETGSFLTQKEISRLAKDFMKVFLSCSENRTIDTCQKQVTPKVMASVLRLAIPREIAKIFAESSKSYLSRKQLKRIDIARTMRYWMAPGKTKRGQSFIDYIIKEMNKGKSIRSIQESKKMRLMIYEMLVSSRRFFEALIFELIQPELNKEKANPSSFLQRLFISKAAYDWKQIRPLPEGEIVVAFFKKTFKRLALGQGDISNADLTKAKDLVKDGVVSLNTKIGKEKMSSRLRNK